MTKINFKSPKYIIPTIAYIGLEVVGLSVINLFETEVTHDTSSDLQKTEYLNADLPSANVSDAIGSKRKNVRDAFGNIMDRSAIQDFAEDRDTVEKKESFESKYSEDELKVLDESEKQQEEIKRLREMNERLRQSQQKGVQMGSKDYALPMSEEERLAALAKRRSEMFDELEKDLGGVRSRGAVGIDGAGVLSQDSSSVKNDVTEVSDKRLEKVPSNAVTELDEESASNTVVKKSSAASSHFNTLSSNESRNNLISAIIDEEIKAVDGSRVRLRLLDDIDIGGITVRKGTYLYAQMSGFGQQRVKGKVNSVLIGDEILKVNLSLYDTSDGLEGLYVPQSQFRETAKDIGSSAMQGSMNIGYGTGGNSVTQWAGQALQNAYQQASSAISKAIKKNRVRLKYGTQVYLVNGRTEKKSQK